MDESGGVGVTAAVDENSGGCTSKDDSGSNDCIRAIFAPLFIVGAPVVWLRGSTGTTGLVVEDLATVSRGPGT